jgi:hypothetical protein
LDALQSPRYRVARLLVSFARNVATHIAAATLARDASGAADRAGRRGLAGRRAGVRPTAGKVEAGSWQG